MIENETEKISLDDRTAVKPTAWTPGVTWEGDEGEIITRPEPQPYAHWDDIIKSWGYDPEKYEIIEPVKISVWDQQGKEGIDKLWSYRAGIRAKPIANKIPYDDLVREIKKHRPLREQENGNSAFVACIADLQMGKALADDTEILTTDGWKTHGELCVGDQVYGPTGKPVYVLNTTGSSIQDAYKIVFDDHSEIIASGDHLWNVGRHIKKYDASSRNINSGYGGYQEKYNILTTKEIQQKTFKTRNYYIDLPEPLHFDNQLLSIDPYILGAWLGDGNSRSGRITVGPEDINYWLPYGKYMDHEQYGCKALKIDGLTSLLKKEGLYANKHIPVNYLMGSYEQRLALLQGLMDTDGSCYNSSGTCEFSNTNKKIADGVVWLLNSLGIKPHITSQYGKLNGVQYKLSYRITFNTNNELNVFRMPRKIVNMKSSRSKKRSVRHIRSIESIGNISCQCITVEGGLYLAGRELITTHNCDGDGLAGTIKRFIRCIDGVENRIKELRKIGRQLDTLVVVGLGDLIENCDQSYASQTFNVELNLRDQVKIARRLIRDAIARWSKMFNRVIVTAVPGNHGEVRRDGRAYTTPGDNFDVAIFETLEEVFSFNNEAYGHIEWKIPKDDISTILDLFNIKVGFAHGHITKGGGTPQQKLKGWWEDQSFGEQAIGKARILITGHYHHLSLIEYGRKTHIQCPTLDGGSEYWVNLTGSHSPPGMLTLVVGQDSGQNGYNDLKVIL